MKHIRLGAMTVLAQGLAVICGCLLALLLALSLTLFREGYYLHKLDGSDCLQTIYDNIQQGGHTIAETAGLRGDILESVVTPEDVRVAVIRRADEIWHGAMTQPESPYQNLVAYLQDTIARETGVQWNAADTDRYDTVRILCNNMWDSSVIPPLFNLLSLLMQYRQVAWVLMVVLALIVVFCLWLQSPQQRGWKAAAEGFAATGTAVALGCLLVCLMIHFSGWQSWMPSTDAAYALYVDWFRGLAPVVVACGLALAVVLWTVAFLFAQNGCKTRKRVGKADPS